MLYVLAAIGAAALMAITVIGLIVFCDVEPERIEFGP